MPVAPAEKQSSPPPSAAGVSSSAASAWSASPSLTEWVPPMWTPPQMALPNPPTVTLVRLTVELLTGGRRWRQIVTWPAEIPLAEGLAGLLAREFPHVELPADLLAECGGRTWMLITPVGDLASLPEPRVLRLIRSDGRPFDIGSPDRGSSSEPQVPAADEDERYGCSIDFPTADQSSGQFKASVAAFDITEVTDDERDVGTDDAGTDDIPSPSDDAKRGKPAPQSRRRDEGSVMRLTAAKPAPQPVRSAVVAAQTGPASKTESLAKNMHAPAKPAVQPKPAAPPIVAGRRGGAVAPPRPPPMPEPRVASVAYAAAAHAPRGAVLSDTGLFELSDTTPRSANAAPAPMSYPASMSYPAPTSAPGSSGGYGGFSPSTLVGGVASVGSLVSDILSRGEPLNEAEQQLLKEAAMADVARRGLYDNSDSESRDFDDQNSTLLTAAAIPARQKKSDRKQAEKSKTAAGKDQLGDDKARDEKPKDEPQLRRRASVRWFKQMNPDQMFPMTVAIGKARMKQINVDNVGHAVGDKQLLIPASYPYVRIKPVMPGCQVFPEEQTIDVTPDMATARFQVLPLLVGEIPDARVELYWKDRKLSDITLPTKVTKQLVAGVLATAAAAWPFLSSGLGNNSDKASLVSTVAYVLSLPCITELILLGAAVGAVVSYLRNLPQESNEETDVLAVKAMTVPELLSAAETAMREGRYSEAVGLLEDAENLSPKNRAVEDLMARARRHTERVSS